MFIRLLVWGFMLTLLLPETNAQSRKKKWKNYQFATFQVQNAFPTSAAPIEIDVQHPYVFKESAASYDAKSETTYQLTILHHAALYDRPATGNLLEQAARYWKQEADEILRTDTISAEGRNALRIISRHPDEGFSIWQFSKQGGNLFVHEVIHMEGDFDKKLVEKFVSALVVDDPGNPQWFRMQDSIAAISYLMPARPTTQRQEFDMDYFGTNRKVVVRTELLREQYQNYNYLVLYRDNPPGIVYEAIDTTLKEYQSIYEERFNRKAKNVRRTLIDDYHALELTFDLSRTTAEMAIILRSNRVYIVMIEELPGGRDLAEKKKKFFSSVRFLPLTHMELSEFAVSDSTTVYLPTEPLRDTNQLYNYPFEEYYSLYSLDTLSGVTYTVDDYFISPYFSVENYDSLLQADYDSLLTTPGLLRIADTTFQGGRAFYFVHEEADRDIHLFELAFYRGAHYYNLIAVGSREYTDSMAWAYFNGLDIQHTKYPRSQLSTNHFEALWADLYSRDSVTQVRAKNALSNQELSSHKLDQMYVALRQDLSWDTITSPKIQQLFFDQFVHHGKSASVRFLDTLFQASSADTMRQFQILEALLRFQTPAALETFFPLARSFDPLNQQKIEYWSSFYALRDTLSLASNYLEGWLSLLEHRSMRYYALDLIDELLADSLIQATEVMPFLPVMISEGNRIIQENDLYQRDTIEVLGEIYDVRKINSIFSRMPAQAQSLDYLGAQYQYRDLSFLRSAAQASIKLKSLPPDSVLTKIYEEAPGEWYLILYAADAAELLEKIKPERRSQKAVVKSYLSYMLEFDWVGLSSIEIIDQRPMSKGETKYQVYIAKYKLDNETNSYYAICVQPESTSEVQLPPVYYDYILDENKSKKAQVKELLENFVEWEE